MRPVGESARDAAAFRPSSPRSPATRRSRRRSAPAYRSPAPIDMYNITACSDASVSSRRCWSVRRAMFWVMTFHCARSSIARPSSTRSFSTTAAALPELTICPGVEGAVGTPADRARTVMTNVFTTALRDTRPRKCGRSANAGATARTTMTATHTRQRASRAITGPAPEMVQPAAARLASSVRGKPPDGTPQLPRRAFRQSQPRAWIP